MFWQANYKEKSALFCLIVTECPVFSLIYTGSLIQGQCPWIPLRGESQTKPYCIGKFPFDWIHVSV